MKPSHNHRRQTKGSTYPSTPAAPAPAIVETIRSHAVRDLMAAFRFGLSELQLHTDPSYYDREQPTSPAMEARLLVAARRVTTDRSEHPAIVCGARPFLDWAMKYTPVRNPAILARFAVQMAYDFTYRINLSSTLTYHWLTRWRSKYVFERGEKRLQLVWWPDVTGYFPPIPMKDKDRLALDTDRYGEEKLPPVNLVDHYCGIKPSYLWVFDAIRPPLQSIRAVATLIDRELNGDLPDPVWEFGNHPHHILGLELGHSAAAQALAMFLPGAVVTTSSLIYQGTQHDHRPKKFNAVVVNLPNAAAMEFTKFILARHRSEPPWPIHRHELDRFWKWPKSDPGNHCDFLMTLALTQLADDGLLIVLGDIETGLLHQAANLIRRDPTLRPIRIAGNDRPVMFQYKNPKVWGLYSSLRPTGRLMAAWRRTP